MNFNPQEIDWKNGDVCCNKCLEQLNFNILENSIDIWPCDNPKCGINEE